MIQDWGPEAPMTTRGAICRATSKISAMTPRFTNEELFPKDVMLRNGNGGFGDVGSGSFKNIISNFFLLQMLNAGFLLAEVGDYVTHTSIYFGINDKILL